jgi:hypothetical protein
MNVRWTSHLKDPEKRKDFEQYIRNSTTILERLTEIINNKIDALDCPAYDSDYEDSAWAYKQADRNGQLRAYLEILKLTNLSTGED